MSTEIASELSSFHRFITERLDQGETDLTPEQALDIWRASHSAPEEYDETVAALREALDAMKAGDRGVPWDDFSREFRAKRGIPPGRSSRSPATKCESYACEVRDNRP